jgi:hypothetical protein
MTTIVASNGPSSRRKDTERMVTQVTTGTRGNDGYDGFVERTDVVIFVVFRTPRIARSELT